MLNQKVNVKSWFLNKSLSNHQLFAIKEAMNDNVVVAETEKAVKVEFKTNYGKINLWVPKSCLSECAEEIKNAIYEIKTNFGKTMLAHKFENGIYYCGSKNVAVAKEEVIEVKEI